MFPRNLPRKTVGRTEAREGGRTAPEPEPPSHNDDCLASRSIGDDESETGVASQLKKGSSPRYKGSEISLGFDYACQQPL